MPTNPKANLKIELTTPNLTKPVDIRPVGIRPVGIKKIGIQSVGIQPVGIRSVDIPPCHQKTNRPMVRFLIIFSTKHLAKNGPFLLKMLSVFARYLQHLKENAENR
jgi:hypothetical protein